MLPSDLLDEVIDYGVYAHDVNVDFDVEELSDSDASVDEEDNLDEHEIAGQHQNANQGNRVKNTTARQRREAYMKHCLPAVTVEN